MNTKTFIRLENYQKYTDLVRIPSWLLEGITPVYGWTTKFLIFEK